MSLRGLSHLKYLKAILKEILNWLDKKGNLLHIHLDTEIMSLKTDSIDNQMSFYSR